MPRRRGIEHCAPAERRLAAEDHAVAACGNDRPLQPQLGEALADPRDPGGSVRRPEVHLHARVVRDRFELVERDVEAIRRRIGAGCDERLASGDLVPLDAREADGDALARLGSLDVPVVHLDAADPDVAAGRLEPKLVARRPIAPDQSVPVTTVPKPATENERST